MKRIQPETNNGQIRGAPILINGGYQLPHVLKTRDLVLLYPEHPEIDQLHSSVRIRYHAWALTLCNLPFRRFLRLSKLRNRTGDPDRGNIEVSWSKRLAHSGTSYIICSKL